MNANYEWDLFDYGVFKENPVNPCSVWDKDNKRSLINHAVVIVGYSSATTTKGCDGWWIIKNSYGSLWGQSGYFNLCIPSNIDPDVKQTGTCNVHSFVMIADIGNK